MIIKSIELQIFQRKRKTELSKNVKYMISSKTVNLNLTIITPFQRIKLISKSHSWLSIQQKESKIW